MKYLKIRAKTYNEAMMKLKMDHGDDAIPISHKYVKEGGMLKSRFFAKEVVELTAAVQETRSKMRSFQGKSRVDYTVGDSSEKKSNLSNIQNLNKTIDDFNDNLNEIKMKKPEIARDDVSKNDLEENIKQTEKNETVRSAGNNFEKEFHEIKAALASLMEKKGSIPETEQLKYREDDQILKPYVELLENNDFNRDECNRIISEIKNSVSREDLKDKFKIEKSLKDLLKSRIVTTGPLKTGNKKKIIMFIGPTGVGKTTTMAKLGAMFALREDQKVAFVTIDNYRIAATEQLKKYAEIMRIPVYAINNQKDFKNVLLKDKAEIILVDTSGRSHRNDLKISEIKSFADQVEYDFEKILCVSATTKKRDLDEVFRAFDVMHFDSVIATKVDETSFVGNIVDIADKYKKPISYFTNGQEVPNDIVVADSGKIVDMMLPGKSND